MDQLASGSLHRPDLAFAEVAFTADRVDDQVQEIFHDVIARKGICLDFLWSVCRQSLTDNAAVTFLEIKPFLVNLNALALRVVPQIEPGGPTCHKLEDEL